MEDSAKKEVLRYYSEVLANLKDMLNEDIMVLITDQTHVIDYHPGIDLAIREQMVGKEIAQYEHIVEAIRTGQRDATYVPVGRYHFPFLSINYPIKSPTGEVVGCAGICRSLEKEHRVEETSRVLADNLEQINAGMQEVSAGTQSLSGAINEVVRSVNESASKVGEIDKVIKAISDISAHSNLLGLNAAIEAGRAGEQGRGFAVVAEEMRGLAAQSNESAKMVTAILSEVKEALSKINQEIREIANIAESQASATEQITANIEEVSENSQVLVEQSRIG